MELKFTGERPVPGLMTDNIYDGVIARYIFAYEQLTNFGVKKVLDVGCGTGVGTSYFANKGYDSFGIDIDQESIRWGQEHVSHPNLTLVQGSGEKLPFNDSSFDVITAFECIEHMESPYAFIQEVKRILKPGGQFICSVPFGLDDMFAELLNGEANKYHLQRFTPQTMHRLLSENFTIKNEYGQVFRDKSHFLYLFVNWYAWNLINRIPLIGTFLNYVRNKRNGKIALHAGNINAEKQKNTATWSIKNIPHHWIPQTVDSKLKKIPETLIYCAVIK